MKELSIDELVSKAKGVSSADAWHFHYLTPKCIFNESGKHKIVLEIGEDVFCWLGAERPSQLETLEHLFYNRV